MKFTHVTTTFSVDPYTKFNPLCWNLNGYLLGLEWSFKICTMQGFGNVDWIHMAHDRDWWQALVNMEMNLWVS
jgi:hypothetical protein